VVALAGALGLAVQGHQQFFDVLHQLDSTGHFRGREVRLAFYEVVTDVP